MRTQDIIAKQLADNPVIIYMKGVPTAPDCGFSAKAVGILNSLHIPFAYVDVLKSPFIREKLPKISKWPTFPQLFVHGELVGGCDIIEAMSQDGSLNNLLQTTLSQTETDSSVISHSEVESLISGAYPDAKIRIDGQGCDLSIIVVSTQFESLPMVKQHQGVMATLNEAIASGRLHAITLKTLTPSQWQESQTVFNPHLMQIQH
jgi:monothiol glutaredoxin